MYKNSQVFVVVWKNKYIESERNKNSFTKNFYFKWNMCVCAIDVAVKN